MIENYESGSFEGGVVGEKTDQVFALLEENLQFTDASKIVSGNPSIGRIEFEPPVPFTTPAQWVEFRSAVMQVCQECSTEEITVRATADNATQKFTITITETE